MTVEIYFGLLMGAQILACLLPLCGDLKPRPHPAPRIIAASALVLFTLWVCITLPIPTFLNTASLENLLSSFIFASVLLAFVAAMLIVWDVSIWQALFCCTAAYTAQNIMSGFEFVFRTLAGSEAVGLFQVVVLRTLVPTALVLPAYLALFANNVRRQRLEYENDREMLLFAPLVIVVVITLDIAIKQVPSDQASIWGSVVMRFAHEAICIFILYAEYKVLLNRKLTSERAVERGMIKEQRRQYEMNRQTVDAINMKCHDIRHQIRALSRSGQATEEALADLEQEVSIYDSTVRTGNAALDIILTEKGLICSQQGIQLCVVANGEALAQLSPSEIYAFFGNALDNAIEAVGIIDDHSRRVITLDIHAQMNMTIATIENYCMEEPTFVDGLPLTSKAERAEHGFGTRSMRRIVEQHGGVLKLGCKDGVFHLDALIPAKVGS